MTKYFSPIISSHSPVGSGPHVAPPPRPGVAEVYSRPDGTVISGADAPGRWFRRMLKLGWTRHLVDVGDQRRTVTLGNEYLPSRDVGLFFEAVLDIGFKVDDPAEVVRRNVTAAEPIVINHLVNRLRELTRDFDIEESRAVEIEANHKFASSMLLPEGLCIYHLYVRVTPDAASRKHMAARRQASRTGLVNEANHREAVKAVERENQLKEIVHAAELNRHVLALERMSGLALDPYQLLLAHVAEHPQDTQGTFDLLMQVWQAGMDHEDNRDTRANDMLRYLIDKGVIQAVDVERFRGDLTEQVRKAAMQRPRTDAGWGDDPVMPPAPLGTARERPAGKVNGTPRPRSNLSHS